MPASSETKILLPKAGFCIQLFCRAQKPRCCLRSGHGEPDLPRLFRQMLTCPGASSGASCAACVPETRHPQTWPTGHAGKNRMRSHVCGVAAAISSLGTVAPEVLSTATGNLAARAYSPPRRGLLPLCIPSSRLETPPFPVMCVCLRVCRQPKSGLCSAHDQ